MNDYWDDDYKLNTLGIGRDIDERIRNEAGTTEKTRIQDNY